MTSVEFRLNPVPLQRPTPPSTNNIVHTGKRNVVFHNLGRSCMDFSAQSLARREVLGPSPFTHGGVALTFFYENRALPVEALCGQGHPPAPE